MTGAELSPVDEGFGVDVAVADDVESFGDVVETEAEAKTVAVTVTGAHSLVATLGSASTGAAPRSQRRLAKRIVAEWSWRRNEKLCCMSSREQIL